MKIKYFLWALLLGIGFIATPNLTKASGDINLKEVLLSSPVNTTTKTFTVKASLTDILVAYDNNTKVSGAPKEFNYNDWQVTDKLSITGQVIGYENNLLKIQAQIIKFDFSKNQLKNTLAFVNNTDPTNKKVWLAIKEKNEYAILEVVKVGEAGGPKLFGFNSLNEMTNGSAVTVSQVSNKYINNSSRIISINKISKAENLQLINIVRNGTGFSLANGTPSVTKLTKGQKFAIQNKSGVNLYFSTSGESAKFSPKPSNGHILLKPGSSVKYTVNPSTLIGPINLPFKTEVLETAATVLTVQLEIIN